MKKVILFAAVLFSSISIMNVQAADPKSGVATLTLNLNPFQSIYIANDAGSTFSKDVHINYTSETDYIGGVSSELLNDYIKVVAAGGYEVSVNSTNFIHSASTVDPISAESVSINITEGSGTVSADATLAANKNLIAGGELVLVTSKEGKSGTGVDGKKFNVQYKAANQNLYTNKVVNSELTSYTSTLTYSISVQ